MQSNLEEKFGVELTLSQFLPTHFNIGRTSNSAFLIVPPGDVQALAEAMKWMVTHGQKAKEIGQAAREYAMREHSSQKHYERLMQIYERVLN